MKQSKSKQNALDLPTYLVPVVPDASVSSGTVTNALEHPLLDILRAHVAFEDDSRFFATPSSAGVTKLVLALITQAHSPNAAAAVTHTLPESLFPLSRLTSCQLVSLPPRQQTLRPPVVAAGASREPLAFTLSFSAATPCADTDYCLEYRGSSSAQTSRTVPAALPAATPAYASAASGSLLAAAHGLLQRQGLLAEAGALTAALLSPSDAALLLPDHPALIGGGSQSCADHTGAGAPASAFLETHSSAAAAVSAGSRLKASLGAIVETSLAPMVPQVTNVINGVYGSLLQTQFAYALVPSLTEAISKDLMRMVPAHLKLAVPSAVAEIVKDQLPGPVARAVAERVTWAVANKLTDHLVKHVTPVVAEVSVRKLALSVPGKVAHLALGRLAPMLTKSLTHSIVPALSETLSHSPLRMSWCEACREHGKLCQYCWQNPTQNHAAMHYAGYYSTYYADYYSRYFDEELQQRRAEAQRKVLDLELVRNRFEFVRDVGAG